MQFKITYSSILPMLQLCKKQLNGTLEEDKLRQLLRHEDYQFEFSRYGKSITEDQFVDYFLRMPCSTDEITNSALRSHHEDFLYLFNNLDYFFEKVELIPSILSRDIFQKQINFALQGLPSDLILPDMKYVFTIGIGGSYGYVHGNGSHYDFIQLMRNYDIESFHATIAHETHHVGFNAIQKCMDIDSLPLEALFFFCFAGEGLAVKYCNNAEGVISKAIYQGPKNIGLDSFSWDYLNNDFDDTIRHFKDSITQIRNNDIKNLEDLEKHLLGYWLNPYTRDQKPGEIAKLKQSRLYSLGNDIWGVIHDCFGRDVVYDTLLNPQKFIPVFNRAMQNIDKRDLQIDSP